ncbi:MAG: metallophosphoesterase family protein [Bradymonadia bacterium]
MRWLCTLLVLAGCTNPTQEREEGAETQATRTLTTGLTVEVTGGAIQSVTQTDGDSPFVVKIRATDFEVEATVSTTSCTNQGVTFEVDYLGCPGQVDLTRRAFLATDVFSETLPGRAVGFEADVDAPSWTPLEGEWDFSDLTQVCDANNIETLIWTTTLSRASLQVQTGLGTVEQVPPGGNGACAGPFTEDDDIGEAALAVRHRASRRSEETGPVRFALWANDRGDQALRQRFIDDIGVAEVLPDFLIINGDFTSDGDAGEIATIADFDTTGLPWYATVGDRDISAEQTGALLDALGLLTFRIDVGPLELIVLDSADATLGSRAYSLMDEWFGGTRRGITVVVTHIPPFDTSGLRGYSFKNRLEGARLVSLLSREGVSALITSQLEGYRDARTGPLRVISAGSAGTGYGEGTNGPFWLMVTAGCVPIDQPDATPGACSNATADDPNERGVIQVEVNTL